MIKKKPCKKWHGILVLRKRSKIAQVQMVENGCIERKSHERVGIAIQTRTEQMLIVFIRAMDALGVTWLVTRTAKWLI